MACSSCSPQGEMSSLPDLIIVTIFEHLKRHDLISASSVCRKWREIILNFRSFEFWTKSRRSLNLNPVRLFSDRDNGFHIQMCEKYVLTAKELSLYVCQCQQTNFLSLISTLGERDCLRPLKMLYLRKACVNKCCKDKTSNIFHHLTKPLCKLNLTNLQKLSFGFDCNLEILSTLSQVYCGNTFNLQILNVGTLSEIRASETLDLSWMKKLQELTINWEHLQENVLQSWLGDVGDTNLHTLKIMSVGVQSISSVVNNSHQETWTKIQTQFPSFQIHVIFVAISMPLSVALRKVCVQIPVQHCVALYKLSPQTQRGSFKNWFNFQHSPRLETLKVCGIEPAGLRLMETKEGEEWLEFCSRSTPKIRQLAIGGMYIADSDILRFLQASSNLQDLCISRHDIVVNSSVQQNFQISPNKSQLRSIENLVSIKMNKEWKIDRSVPIQHIFKNKGISTLDTARSLLYGYEDEASNNTH